MSRRADQREEQTVTAAGRLVDKKGFDLLLRAAVHLPSRVRVQIVGDGPQRRSLERLAIELGLEDRIDFVGRKDSAEVLHLMTRADVVVVPSRIEAFGIVVLEAWASGTPLVATSRGGPSDIVTDGLDGRLADPEDTPAFAQTIAEVLSNQDASHRMAQRGLQSVLRYTWDRVTDDYERIYEVVLSDREWSRRPRRLRSRRKGDVAGT